MVVGFTWMHAFVRLMELQLIGKCWYVDYTSMNVFKNRREVIQIFVTNSTFSGSVISRSSCPNFLLRIIKSLQCMHGWQQGMFGPETRKRQKLRLSGKKNRTLFVSCAPFEHCCVKWTLETCGGIQGGMHIILVNCHVLFEHTENLPLKWSYPSPILDPSVLVSESSGTPFLRMSCCSPHSVTGKEENRKRAGVETLYSWESLEVNHFQGCWFCLSHDIKC